MTRKFLAIKAGACLAVAVALPFAGAWSNERWAKKSPTGGVARVATAIAFGAPKTEGAGAKVAS